MVRAAGACQRQPRSGMTDEAWDEGGYYIAPPLISSQRCPGKNSRDEAAQAHPIAAKDQTMKHFTILNREQLLARSYGDQPTTAAATIRATECANRAYQHDIADHRSTASPRHQPSEWPFR